MPIDRFARLCASLSDPFAARDDVLRAAGLTEAAFEGISTLWCDRMRHDPTVVQRFQEVYVEAQRSDGTSPAAEPAGPVAVDPVTWRKAAALVPLSALDATPPPLCLPDAALPRVAFEDADDVTVILVPVVPAKQVTDAALEEGTLAVDPAAASRPPLPFVPAPPGAPIHLATVAPALPSITAREPPEDATEAIVPAAVARPVLPFHQQAGTPPPVPGSDPPAGKPRRRA